MIAAWALALLFGAGAWWMAGFAARRLPPPHPLEELSYYPSGKFLEPTTLGHAETFADLAWLRAVQYYGEHSRTDMRFINLYHVFEVLTSLSPHFIPAYVFGGFALAQEGRDFDHAEALMLKGIEANPNSGQLAFELGFLYYVRTGGRKLRQAGEFFEQAARLPDGPRSSRRFAAYVRQNAGDLVVALALWREVTQTSDNEYVKEMAEREIKRIEIARRAGRDDLARNRVTTPVVIINPGR